jgi:GntR family transcriptional repressor for pyruvate dehydrogenase complex
MDSPSPAAVAVFDPVQPPSTFEVAVARLGSAIRLGLLPPATRLPPERVLAEQLDISRSTLRQALMTLTQTGHLVAIRGRSGGTFVADAPPLTSGEPIALEGRWRDLLDYRVAVETGAILLAAERARPEDIARLEDHVATMRDTADFTTYRRADVAFHLGLAEAAHAPRLVSAMTELQGEMTELIGHIPHPEAVLNASNAQHRRMVDLVRKHDGVRAVKLIRDHLHGTEHILAGLLP